MADYFFDINGLSKHLGEPVEYSQKGSDTPAKYNESNFGFGVTREDESNGLVRLLTAGRYNNSFGNPTNYAGAGIAKRFGSDYYADIGVMGGAMTGYEDKLSPMAAIYSAVGKKDKAKLRLMYAPESEVAPPVLMMNLGIPFK